jgi:hypothetical protein
MIHISSFSRSHIKPLDHLKLVLTSNMYTNSHVI